MSEHLSTSFTGGVETRIVPEHLATACTDADDEAILFQTLLGVVVGIGGSAGVALIAGVTHPIPIYLVIAASGAATGLLTWLMLRAKGKATAARDALRSANSISVTVSPGPSLAQGPIFPTQNPTASGDS